MKERLEQPEEFYIPTIDEFCIGFEYEQNFPIWWRSNDWNKLQPENKISDGSVAKEDRWSKQVFKKPFMNGTSISHNLNANLIRVPKLRTADIFAEGWHMLEETKHIYKSTDSKLGLQKNNYLLVWYRYDYIVDFIFRDPSLEINKLNIFHPERFRLYTKCPTINHFRKIEKLLP